MGPGVYIYRGVRRSLCHPLYQQRVERPGSVGFLSTRVLSFPPTRRPLLSFFIFIYFSLAPRRLCCQNAQMKIDF